MGGKPDQFQVTNLDVLVPNGAFGVPQDVMDVIVVKTGGAGGDAFDLLVEFECSPRTAQSWNAHETTSDTNVANNNPPETAVATFYAESIGPGPELNLGANSVPLTVGGDQTINSDTSKSVYQIRLAIADANTVFNEPNPAAPPATIPAPALYRIGCTVNYTPPFVPPPFTMLPFDAFWQQDLLVRVVEEP